MCFFSFTSPKKDIRVKNFLHIFSSKQLNFIFDASNDAKTCNMFKNVSKTQRSSSINVTRSKVHG